MKFARIKSIKSFTLIELLVATPKKKMQSIFSRGKFAPSKNNRFYTGSACSLTSECNVTAESGFTLIELLVVIGILAILTAAVFIALNPVEYLKQSRDATRSSDLHLINNALSVYEQQVSSGYFGQKNTVYVSVPDDSAVTSTCPSLGLPALPAGWNYGCVNSANLRNTNGTGWIPVDFSQAQGLSLPVLPIDPVNSTSTQEYYTYTPGGSWVLTSPLESQKYQTSVGNTPDKTRFQLGTDIGLVASTIYGGAAPQAPVQLTVSADTSSIVADKYSLDADGTSAVTFTITAKDASGNPISGATVVLASSGSSNTLTQPSNTNSSGQTTGTLKSTSAENKTVSVTINSTLINQSALITFNAPCVGTDFAGADYTATTTSLSSSVDTIFCNVGTFTVPAGITLTLGATRKFEVRAQSASILGTISGTGMGYAKNTGPGKATASNCGGSYGGYATCSSAPNGNPPYGSATNPSDLGSGGGDSAGGGYIKLVISGTLTNSGIITASGANGNSTGSGGTINITASTITGGGSIIANGGATGYVQGGSGGRIALVYSTNTFSGTLSAYGGNYGGGAGSIFKQVSGQSTGTLTYDNGGISTFAYSPIDNGIDSSINSITLANKAYGLASSTSISNVDVSMSTSTLVMYGANTLKSLTVNQGGVVTHNANSASLVNYINLTAANITVNSGGFINVDARGYASSQGTGKNTASNCGGSYGGYGSCPSNPNGNPPYGSATNPSDIGSGGYNSAGGGYIKLILSGTLAANGTITASGGAGNASGSGGTINITAATITGSGSIIANGGATGYVQGGSGGRIALVYSTNTFSGTLSAYGGNKGGGAGSIYKQVSGQSTGILTYDNGGIATFAYSPIDNGIDSAVSSIVLANSAYGLASSTSISNVDVSMSTSTLVMYGANTFKSLTVNSGGLVTHNYNSTTKTNYIDITASNITINTGGQVNVMGRGYATNQGPGKPSGNTGAGHGGVGGGASGGPVYDSQTAPADLGSGGAGSSGGGYAKFVASGSFTLNGTINTNGSDSPSPGSGGGAYISAGTFAGSGTISANAGATGYSTQGGGGGRIAYYYTTKTFNGTITATQSQNGGAGTIYDAGAGSYPGPLGMIQNNNLANENNYKNYFANILSIFEKLFK